jgi:hypothetical protein
MTRDIESLREEVTVRGRREDGLSEGRKGKHDLPISLRPQGDAKPHENVEAGNEEKARESEKAMK